MTKVYFKTIFLLLLSTIVFANGAKISELKKEAKNDGDGKLFLSEFNKLNAPNGLNPVSLSNLSIIGEKSFRFEVNHGECGQNNITSDCETERERVELYYTWKNKDDFEKWKKEKWYRFYVFVPKEYNNLAPAKTSIIQFKRYLERSKVLVMFQLHHGGLYFNINGDTFKPDIFYHLKYFKDLREQWTEILFNTNWHPDADKGFMKVWIDGKMKIDYKGTANHPEGKDLNLRYGIYTSFLDKYRNTFSETKHKQRVLYFDGVRGDTTCKKLLKDNKRCNELLSQTVSEYRIYNPNNFKTVKKFKEDDLKSLVEPAILDNGNNSNSGKYVHDDFSTQEINFLMTAKDEDEKCIRKELGPGLDLLRKDTINHKRYTRPIIITWIKKIIKNCSS